MSSLHPAAAAHSSEEDFPLMHSQMTQPCLVVVADPKSAPVMESLLKKKQKKPKCSDVTLQFFRALGRGQD